jgi:hypothetical protein
MALTWKWQDLTRTKPPGSAAPLSHALQWLWEYLSQVPHPHVLDCGPVHQSSLNILLGRGAKVHVANLITSLQRSGPSYWSVTEKTRLFLTDDFLAQIPDVPAGSLSVVLSWDLLDLIPHEALPAVVERLSSYLQSGGVLFAILREPYLTNGADTRWWFESLTTLACKPGKPTPFPYAPISNREMEKLIPGGNVKTFLTRSGRREVLGVK